MIPVVNTFCFLKEKSASTHRTTCSLKEKKKKKALRVRKMKRVRSRQQEEELQLCPVFPPELWPPIFSYLSVVQRYQWLTVCKQWGQPYGLVDQSITVIRYHYEGAQSFIQSLQPNRLACMLNLSVLDATLTEEISNQLGAHSMHLKVLHLSSYCTENGDENIGCGDGISKLTNLTTLDLARTAQLSMSNLTGLTSLTHLGVYKNSGLQDEGLGAFTRLTSLFLQRTEVSDEALTLLTNLETLILCDNDNISGTTLCALPKLRNLFVTSHYKLIPEEVFRSLNKLDALTVKISIFTCRMITHLTSLRSLSIQAANIRESQTFASFLNLTRLVIKDNYQARPARGAFGNGLSVLTNLRVLKLNDHSVGGVCTDDVLSCLSNLTTLCIYANNCITRSSLSTLTNLTKLKLPHDRHLTRLDTECLPLSLTTLDLSNCNHTSPFRGMTENLQNLRVLILDTVSISCLLGTENWESSPLFKSLQLLRVTPIGRHHYSVDCSSIRRRLHQHFTLLNVAPINKLKYYFPP